MIIKMSDIGPDEISTHDLETDISIDATNDNEDPIIQTNHSFYSTIQENNISSLPPGYTQHQIYGSNRVIVSSFIDEPLDETPQDVLAFGERSDASFDPVNSDVNSPLSQEIHRLRTFDSKWPPHYPVVPADLARNGFFYVGPGDRVICYFCRGVLKNWSPGDTVETEHRKHFPNCPINSPSGSKSGDDTVSMHHSDSMGIFPNQNSETSLPTNRENLGIVNMRPKHPQFAIESDRLATFNTWPTQMKQKPEDLARAGLFYLGKGDRVKCFCCDGMLHSWDPTDDPMSEHARWFPDCAFVKLCQEDNSNSMNCASGQITENLETNASVQALFDNGYSLEAVSRAIEKLHIDGVNENEIPSAQKILETILESDSGLEVENHQTTLQNGTTGSSEDVNALISENVQLKEQRLCKICLENEISVIFLPCGHLAACGQCASSIRDCPICRTAIKGTAKAYWS